MYNGTVVTSDPALIETREIGEHMHAYVLADQDATNPRDREYGDPFGHMVSFARDTIQPDGESDMARQIVDVAHALTSWE